MFEDVKDWRGMPLVVGSQVVWAVAQSSSIDINEGVVLEFLPHQREHYDKPNYCSRGTECGKWCGGFNLRVRPTGQANRGLWKRSLKPVVLTAIERVTVVGQRSIQMSNKEFLAALDDPDYGHHLGDRIQE